MKIKIEAIKKSHLRHLFDCGEPELNTFLSKTARQHDNKGISKTFIIIDEENPNEVVAYYTLFVCEVKPHVLDKKYQKYPHLLPILKLARLAVDKKFQKKDYARLLLANIIHKAIIISEQVGIIGITIDAKNENVAAIYNKYGFIGIGDKGLTLFMPISLCRTLN